MTIKVHEDDYLDAVDENSGWCKSCQEFTGQFAEPDAERYDCDSCGNPTLYGAEQALILGLITF